MLPPPFHASCPPLFFSLRRHELSPPPPPPICPFPFGGKGDFYFIFILINGFESQVVKQLMFIFKRQWKGKSSSLTWQKRTVCSLLMSAWKMTVKGAGESSRVCVTARNRHCIPRSQEIKIDKILQNEIVLSWEMPFSRDTQ